MLREGLHLIQGRVLACNHFAISSAALLVVIDWFSGLCLLWIVVGCWQGYKIRFLSLVGQSVNFADFVWLSVVLDMVLCLLWLAVVENCLENGQWPAATSK